VSGKVKLLHKLKKRMAAGLMVGIMTTTIFHIQATPALAAGETTATPTIAAKAAILIEATTGKVLFEMNADEAREPASMTKMMTEYIVLDAISQGKFKWEDTVQASAYAGGVGGSGRMIAPQEKLPLKDMFALMSIYSGNDGTVALAEHIAGGSEESFVDMMNAKAKELGMSEKTQFHNSTGLNVSDLKKYRPNIDGENKMTARDTATLARRLILDHKEVLDFASITSQKLRPKDKDPMVNWNYMLDGFKNSGSLKQFAYSGLDGLKTGYTNAAGYCFTGTAVKDGMRLISVVMGADKINDRFIETKKLLDYGFSNFEFKQLIDAKSEIEDLKTVEVKKGVELEVPVVTKNELTFIVKKGETPTVDIKAEAAAEDKRVAPLKKGDTVGTATVKYGDTTQTVDLVAAADVEEASWWRMLLRGIKDFFVSLFEGIKSLF